jgi:glycosyltransferase involved in cell wall biosynthesis
MIRPLTVGVCPDFAEERWPSMDRVAAQLLAAIRAHHPDAIEADVVRPAFRRRAMRWSSGRLAYNADRACNRFIDYPLHVRGIARSHDVYHVVDHSYAHLAWHLPAGRTVVTCHDLDAFRSIVESGAEQRSAPFRAATRYILGGLRRASAIACDTAVIAEELVRRAIVPRERVVVAHLGAGDEFTIVPDPDADAYVAHLLPFSCGVPVVLHVGATIPRKRIDVLLRVFAGLQGFEPAPRLVRVGGALTVDQAALAHKLGIDDRVTVLSALDDRHLAAVYRRAWVLALPSDREGFGLPVLEALRCGTAVVASDLAVLREVGAAAARYCPPGDVAAWARAVGDIIRQPGDASDRAARAEWAGSFTWRRYGEQMARIYSAVADRRGARSLCVQAPA